MHAKTFASPYPYDSTFRTPAILHAYPFRGTTIAAAMIPVEGTLCHSRVVSTTAKMRSEKAGGDGGGGTEERKSVFRVGRGLIYSRCNFQYFSDQDRRGCINLGSVHCCPGVSRGRDPQLLGVPRLFQAAKQPRAAGMIDSTKGKKATCITHACVHRRRSARCVRACARAHRRAHTIARATRAYVRMVPGKGASTPTCPLGLPLRDFNCRPLAFF